MCALLLAPLLGVTLQHAQRWLGCSCCQLCNRVLPALCSGSPLQMLCGLFLDPQDSILTEEFTYPQARAAGNSAASKQQAIASWAAAQRREGGHAGAAPTPARRSAPRPADHAAGSPISYSATLPPHPSLPHQALDCNLLPRGCRMLTVPLDHQGILPLVLDEVPQNATGAGLLARGLGWPACAGCWCEQWQPQPARWGGADPSWLLSPPVYRRRSCWRGCASGASGCPSFCTLCPRVRSLGLAIRAGRRRMQVAGCVGAAGCLGAVLRRAPGAAWACWPAAA